MSFFASITGQRSQNLDGATARKLVQDGALLLDVRTPGEFAGGAIPGALNIPVQDLGRRMGELDPKRTTIVYCRSGGRSAQARQLLCNQGFDDVRDLGPISAW